MSVRAATTGSIVRRAVSLLRGSFGDVLLYGVAYRFAVFAVVSPLVALLARGLFALSGRKAVANADLLAFTLSPGGAVTLVVLACVGAGLTIAGHSGVFAIASGRARGRAVHWRDALRLVAQGWRRLLRLSAAIVLRCLAIGLPFVIALGVVHGVFLGEHDINFYLTEKPPELWRAVGIAGVLALVLCLVVGERLVAWCLSLPFVLIDGMPASAALARSREVVARGGHLRVFLLVAAGPVLAALAGALFGGLLAFLGGIAIEAADGSLRTTAVILGGGAVLQAIAALLLSIGGASLAVFLATAYLEAVDPEALPHPPSSASIESGNQWLRSPRTLALGLVTATGVALLLATQLLAGIAAPTEVRIIAHRAGGRLGPENSMEALEASIAAGADLAEIDVLRSSDGVVVVIHDSDLMKIAGLPWKVSETDAEALCRSREEGGGGISTLDEFCRAARGKIPLCVELKYYGWDAELVPSTIAVLEQAGVLETTEIISLEAKGLAQVRALFPEVRTGFLSSVALGNLTRLDVEFLAVADKAATATLVRHAARRDMVVYSWTLNERDAISDAIDRGVIGIITDDPALARDVLRERGELTDVERLLLRFGALRGG